MRASVFGPTEVRDYSFENIVKTTTHITKKSPIYQNTDNELKISDFLYVKI